MARRTVHRGHKPPVAGSKLPIFLVLGGAAILIIAAILAFQKPGSFLAQASGRPSLSVDKEKVDLGDVKLGNPVQVSFEIKNTGDQPIRFSKAPYIEVREGC